MQCIVQNRVRVIVVFGPTQLPNPREADTHTQQLSREIDAAYEARKAGEPNNDERLYRAFLDQARNVARYRVDWSHLPQVGCDIASRAMVKLKGFRGESSVSTWFYRLAVNEAKRALETVISDRNRYVSLTAEDEAEHERQLGIKGMPDDHDTRLDFESRLSRLPLEQAEVISLGREGHSLEEIARKTGLPLGTVRSRHRLAKAKLKKPRKKARSKKK